MFPSAAKKHNTKSTTFLQGKEKICIRVIFGTKNKGTFSYVFKSERIDSGSQKMNWDVKGCVTAGYNTITIDKIFHVSLYPPTLMTFFPKTIPYDIRF